MKKSIKIIFLLLSGMYIVTANAAVSLVSPNDLDSNSEPEQLNSNMFKDVLRSVLYNLESVKSTAFNQTSMPEIARDMPMERVTSDFGRRNVSVGSTNHGGIDIGMPIGTPLYAQGEGKVVYMKTRADLQRAENECNNHSTCEWKNFRCNTKGSDTICKENTTSLKTGLATVLCYGNGLAVAYFHLSKHPAGLRIGSMVQPGDIIGYSGNTGIGGTPHLHYQIAYTPASPDNCKGWDQRKNLLDPLCKFNATNLPFYFKINGKKTAKNLSRNNPENLCADWNLLDGENGVWRGKEDAATQTAMPGFWYNPNSENGSVFLWPNRVEQ